MTTFLDPTLGQVATMCDVFAALRTADVAYPNYEARREQFIQNIELANLKARGKAIEEALRDEFIKPEAATELLTELLDIDKKIEELEPSPVTWFEKE